MSGSALVPRFDRRARLVAVFAAVLALGAMVLTPALSASAHDYLVDSSPEAGSVQTAPLKQVSLTFDDIVLDLSGNGSSSIVQVTGPDGATMHFETGCATVLDRTVTVPVSLGNPGKYSVTWQIVSADGHTVSSAISFSYKPPAGTPRASGSATRPACGGSTASTSRATTAPPSGTTANTGNLGIVIGIAGGIVGLAIIGVIVVILTSRKRPRDENQAQKKQREGWHPDED